MRTRIALLGLVLLPSTVIAQVIQARFVTSGYAWERQDTIGRASQNFYAHQSLQFSLAKDQFSFHAYGQGFQNFGSRDYTDPSYRLYSVSFKASSLFEMVDLAIGRQTIFAGVGVGTIDGGMAGLRLWDSRIRFVGYYGILPPPQYKFEVTKDRENNRMMGGQLILSPIDEVRFSGSYMQRKIQPQSYTAIRRDSLFQPFPIEIRPNATAEEYLSGDLEFDDGELISATLRYDYDLLWEKTSRIQAFVRGNVYDRISVTGEYFYREPRLSYNSIFSVFTYNTINEYEAGVEYAFVKTSTLVRQVFGKFGYVSYGDENSNRITVGVSGSYGSLSFSHNIGYAGKLSGAFLSAGYPMFEGLVTPTVLFSFAQYKLSDQAPSTSALSGAIGAVCRPWSTLAVDAQVQWIRNTIYASDTRLFIRASYSVFENLNLF
ncbi:MAG TPA: hypothetical protein VNN76_11060 [Bacteroidota bacterium]|nr:hypothetical protein [Bacteroidota bacterium]